MTQMLVIADDMTGAADCGVACARYGLRTTVLLDDSEDDANADALSVDCGTRRLAPEIAASETARLLNHFLRDQQTLVYKKLDSTLRGNIGEELGASLAACRSMVGAHHRFVAILAPAYPETGRTTLGGRQFVNGKPLEEAPLFNNDRAPARSDILAILNAVHLRPEPLGLNLIRDDPKSLQDTMLSLARHADVLVCDAETEDDLGRIADASMVLRHRALWAGSAGLARCLPLAAGLTRSSVNRPVQPLPNGPALFVVGSCSPIARQQVARLTSRSDTILVTIPTEVLMTEGYSHRRTQYGLELEQALNAGCNVVVTPSQGALMDASIGPPLTAALAELVRPLANVVGALVATGGETARAVFEKWGIRKLKLFGEVEPGLPFSITSGWNSELPVLTKAGSFGDPESLLRCLDFLRSLDRGESSRFAKGKGPQ